MKNNIVSKNQEFVRGALYAFDYCINVVEDQKFPKSKNSFTNQISEQFDILKRHLKRLKDMIEEHQVVPNLEPSEEVKIANETMKKLTVKLLNKLEDMKNED